MSKPEKTERLHELLEERGIEYECHHTCNEYEIWEYQTEFYYDGTNFEVTDDSDGMYLSMWGWRTDPEVVVALAKKAFKRVDRS